MNNTNHSKIQLKKHDQFAKITFTDNYGAFTINLRRYCIRVRIRI